MNPSQEDIKSAIGYMYAHQEMITSEMKDLMGDIISSAAAKPHEQMIVSESVRKATTEATERMQRITKDIEMLKKEPAICSMLERDYGYDFTDARAIMSGKIQSSSPTSDPDIGAKLGGMNIPEIVFTEKKKLDQKIDLQQ